MAMFAKQHYEAIAATLQKACEEGPDIVVMRYQLEYVAEALADMFEQDNPLFKRGRFIRACHPGVNVKSPKGRRVRP